MTSQALWVIRCHYFALCHSATELNSRAPLLLPMPATPGKQHWPDDSGRIWIIAECEERQVHIPRPSRIQAGKAGGLEKGLRSHC